MFQHEDRESNGIIYKDNSTSRMAQATKWLQAIQDYEECEIEHINSVWPVFLLKQM